MARRGGPGFPNRTPGPPFHHAARVPRGWPSSARVGAGTGRTGEGHSAPRLLASATRVHGFAMVWVMPRGQRPLVPDDTTLAVATRLPTRTVERLESIAAARGVRRSDVVREAIAELIDRESTTAA